MATIKIDTDEPQTDSSNSPEVHLCEDRKDLGGWGKLFPEQTVSIWLFRRILRQYD